MKNKILLEEEIKKFKKLSGILNEAGGTTAWVSEFLNLIKASAKRVPDELLNSTEMKDLISSGKVTLTAAKGISKIEWSKLAIDEIMILLKWDFMFTTFEGLIKKHRIDMSDAAIDTYKGAFKKIAQAYNKIELSYKDAFKQGFNTKGSAGKFFKSTLNTITFGKLRKFFPSYFQKLTEEEYKKMHGWFWLGIGDFKQIQDIFRRHGFPKAVTNLSGQFFRKWCFWTLIHSGANFMLDVTKDIPEDEIVYDNMYEAIADRFLRTYKIAEFHWVFPVAWVIDNVASPLLLGGLAGQTKKTVDEKLNSISTKAKKEKDALERMEKSIDNKKSDSSSAPKKGNYTY